MGKGRDPSALWLQLRSLLRQCADKATTATFYGEVGVQNRVLWPVDASLRQLFHISLTVLHAVAWLQILLEGPHQKLSRQLVLALLARGWLPLL